MKYNMNILENITTDVLSRNINQYSKLFQITLTKRGRFESSNYFYHWGNEYIYIGNQLYKIITVLYLMILYIFDTKYNEFQEHEIIKSTLKTSTIHIVSHTRLKELLSMGTNLSLGYTRDLIC